MSENDASEGDELLSELVSMASEASLQPHLQPRPLHMLQRALQHERHEKQHSKSTRHFMRKKQYASPVEATHATATKSGSDMHAVAHADPTYK